MACASTAPVSKGPKTPEGYSVWGARGASQRGSRAGRSAGGCREDTGAKTGHRKRAVHLHASRKGQWTGSQRCKEAYTRYDSRMLNSGPNVLGGLGLGFHWVHCNWKQSTELLCNLEPAFYGSRETWEPIGIFWLQLSEKGQLSLISLCKP